MSSEDGDEGLKGGVYFDKMQSYSAKVSIFSCYKEQSSCSETEVIWGERKQREQNRGHVGLVRSSVWGVASGKRV